MKKENKKNQSFKEKIKDPSANNKVDKQQVEADNYPVFCFKYLSDTSIKDDCKKNGKFFFDFLMRLKKLSGLG